MSPARRAYLAGPDVFLPDAAARAAELKAICTRHGITGVSPLDALAGEPAAWAALPPAMAIARRNEAHIASCDVLIANLTPFRGPSADPGTAFEMGFMRALGRPVFGWTNAAEGFTARTLAFLGTAARRHADGQWLDGAGMLVESFGLHDNLMLDGAIAAAGGQIFAVDASPAMRWTALDAFEAAVRAAAAWCLIPNRVDP